MNIKLGDLCKTLIVYILLSTFQYVHMALPVNRSDVRRFIAWIESADWIPCVDVCTPLSALLYNLAYPYQGLGHWMYNIAYTYQGVGHWMHNLAYTYQGLGHWMHNIAYTYQGLGHWMHNIAYTYQSLGHWMHNLASIPRFRLLNV